jgi:hypothetical protein
VTDEAHGRRELPGVALREIPQLVPLATQVPHLLPDQRDRAVVVVVVAQHEVNGAGKLLGDLPEHGSDFPPLGKIAADDDGVGVQSRHLLQERAYLTRMQEIEVNVGQPGDSLHP